MDVMDNFDDFGLEPGWLDVCSSLEGGNLFDLDLGLDNLKDSPKPGTPPPVQVTNNLPAPPGPAVTQTNASGTAAQTQAAAAAKQRPATGSAPPLASPSVNGGTVRRASSTGSKSKSKAKAPSATGSKSKKPAKPVEKKSNDAASTSAGALTPISSTSSQTNKRRASSASVQRKSIEQDVTLPQKAEDIRALLKARNMTVAALADQLKVSRHPLSKWMNNRTPTWGHRKTVEDWLARPEQQNELKKLRQQSQGSQDNKKKQPAKPQPQRMPSSSKQKGDSSDAVTTGKPAVAKPRQRQPSQTGQSASTPSAQTIPTTQSSPVPVQGAQATAQAARRQVSQPSASRSPSLQPAERQASQSRTSAHSRQPTSKGQVAPPVPTVQNYYMQPNRKEELPVPPQPAPAPDHVGTTSQRPRSSTYEAYEPLPVNGSPHAAPPGRNMYTSNGQRPVYNDPRADPRAVVAHPHPVARTPPPINPAVNAKSAYGGLSAGITRFTETLKRTTDPSLHDDIDRAVNQFIADNQQMIQSNRPPEEISRLRSKQSKLLLTSLQSICGEDSIKAATEELKAVKEQQQRRHNERYMPNYRQPLPGQQPNRTINSSQPPMGGHPPMDDRQRQVAGQYARLIKAWNHACSCQIENCTFDVCSKIKPSVQHQRDLKAQGMAGRCPPDCRHCGLYNKLCSFSTSQRDAAARAHAMEMRRRAQGPAPGDGRSNPPPNPAYGRTPSGSHMNNYNSYPHYASAGYMKSEHRTASAGVTGSPPSMDASKRAQMMDNKQLSPLSYSPPSDKSYQSHLMRSSGYNTLPSGGYDQAADMSMVADLLGDGIGDGMQMESNDIAGKNLKRKGDSSSSASRKSKKNQLGATPSSSSVAQPEDFANLFGDDSGTLSPVKLEGELGGPLPTDLGSDRPATLGDRNNPPNNPADRLMCVICHDADRKILFLPCSHICTCEKCGNNGKVVTCPICRERITKKSFVFLS